MTGLHIALGVLLALWLISLVRVGGIVEYSEQGVLVRLRIGPFRVELFPEKPKEVKPPKPKKEKKRELPALKEPVPLKEKVGGGLALFQELLPVALEAAGKLVRRLRIDELVLHLTWAAEDPADAVMGWGAAQAAVGTIWPLLDSYLDVRKRDVGVAVDFERTEPIVYARGSLTYTIGQLVSLGLVSGARALSAYLRVRRSRPNPPKKQNKTEDKAAEGGVNGKEGTLS